MTSSLSQMVGRTLKALVMHFHTPLYIIGAAHHRNRVHIANLGWELANAAKVIEPEKPAFGDKMKKCVVGADAKSTVS